MLLEKGSDINCKSGLANDKNGSLLHNINAQLHQKVQMLNALIEYKFDFGKFINFRNTDGQTPFLRLCCNLVINRRNRAFNDKFIEIWKKYINMLEIDDDGNNVLHLLTKKAIYWSDSYGLQYVLETVYFPKHDSSSSTNDKNNEHLAGIQALNHQNTSFGDTPLHTASNNRGMISDDITTKIAHLMTKYPSDAATLYNFGGYLPIHVACICNNWHILAAMMQNHMYPDVNVRTRVGKYGGDNDNGDTPLSLSVKHGHSKCVQILCENKNIQIDDMLFYYAIQSDNILILQCLLKILLRKHDINSWESIEKSKNNKNNNYNSITMDVSFLESLLQFQTSSRNECIVFLNDIINNGFKKHDYFYIALPLNYNLSSIKLDDERTNIPNINVVVNDAKQKPTQNKNNNNNNNNNNDSTEKNSEEEKKEKTVGAWVESKKLGEGGFGEVILGINKNRPNDKVALKFIKRNKNPTQFILNEIVTVSKIYHQNVITLREFNLNPYQDGKSVMLAFEYAPHGELFSVLKHHNFFRIDVTFYCFEQIVSGIAACHGMNIVHRDLKPQNILIGDEYKIKIADFGLSKVIDQENKDEEKYTDVGTKHYKAPELNGDYKLDDIKNSDTDKACDIFSLSIILWKMLNGYDSKPFNQCKPSDFTYRSIYLSNYKTFWDYHNNKKFVEKNYNRFRNTNMIKNLFERMFTFKPSKRITINDIEKHEWIIDMHNHKNFQGKHVYNGILQILYRQSQGNIATSTRITMKANKNNQKSKPTARIQNNVTNCNSNSNNCNNSNNSNSSSTGFDFSLAGDDTGYEDVDQQ